MLSILTEKVASYFQNLGSYLASWSLQEPTGGIARAHNVAVPIGRELITDGAIEILYGSELLTDGDMEAIPAVWNDTGVTWNSPTSYWNA